MASARVATSRICPRTADVTVREPGLRTPRIDMHRCSHSTTTSTPRGWSSATSASAICGGEPLLHLRAAREHVDQPGELAQAR